MTFGHAELEVGIGGGDREVGGSGGRTVHGIGLEFAIIDVGVDLLGVTVIDVSSHLTAIVDVSSNLRVVDVGSRLRIRRGVMAI